MYGLRKEVDEYLHQTFKRMYGAFNQVAYQVVALRPNLSIPQSQLDPFKIVWDEVLVEDVDATSQDGDT